MPMMRMFCESTSSNGLPLSASLAPSASFHFCSWAETAKARKLIRTHAAAAIATHFSARRRSGLGDAERRGPRTSGRHGRVAGRSGALARGGSRRRSSAGARGFPCGTRVGSVDRFSGEPEEPCSGCPAGFWSPWSGGGCSPLEGMSGYQYCRWQPTPSRRPPPGFCLTMSAVETDRRRSGRDQDARRRRRPRARDPLRDRELSERPERGAADRDPGARGARGAEAHGPTRARSGLGIPCTIDRARGVAITAVNLPIDRRADPRAAAGRARLPVFDRQRRQLRGPGRAPLRRRQGQLETR